MKYIMTEEEAAYMDAYQGHFSKKLAAWAIGCMEMEDPATGKVKEIKPLSVDEVFEIFKENNVKIPYESKFDAWYLYHMSLADYPDTLTTDKQRASFVEETICDVDGEPTNVLACFVAKMCNKGIPIYWQEFI